MKTKEEKARLAAYMREYRQRNLEKYREKDRERSRRARANGYRPNPEMAAFAPTNSRATNAVRMHNAIV